MASVFYDSFFRDMQNGSIDLDTDTIKGMLVTATYTPDRATHAKRSDVTNEVTGTGYTAGGATLAGKTVTADTTNHRGVFDADDLTWTGSTITARGIVLYKARGGVATADELIAYIDFGANVISTAANFLVTWNAGGIFYFG